MPESSGITTLGGGNMPSFWDNARRMARNPLGVLALFLAVVYGVAGLFFKLSGAVLSANQKWVFVVFLVGFPLLILGVFAWLVVRHPGKLYAPTDFQTEEGFIRSLTVARTTAGDEQLKEPRPSEVIQGKAFGPGEVEIDGKTFLKCAFNRTVLVFRGLGPVSFVEAAFIDVAWKLVGPAALSADFIRKLYQLGGPAKQLVQNTLEGTLTARPKDNA